MECHLTNRQLELVCHLANGLRTAEAAKVMHISIATVDRTIKAARNKNNAHTVAHLVSIAIASGLLEWNEEDSGRSVASLTPTS